MKERMKSFILGIGGFITMIVMNPMVALATSNHSDAVQDIMNNERFQGAIQSIEWLTARIDKYSTMVITLSAFFIIVAAMLRNVFAGVYCSNHKLFDEVHKAHEQKTNSELAQKISNASGGKEKIGAMLSAMSSGGGLKNMFLRIIPDFKAMSEFEDENVDPKQYWSKALVQMLGCICIGIFIYNGYYRDTAATVGQFGSEICNRVFNSVDPVSFLDKMTETTSTPPNIYAKDTSSQGKACYTLSMAIYRKSLSEAKGISSTANKEVIMRFAEDMAYKITTKAGELGGSLNVSEDGEAKRLWDSTVYTYKLSSASVNVISDSASLSASMTDSWNGGSDYNFSITPFNNDSTSFNIAAIGEFDTTVKEFMPDTRQTAKLHITFALKSEEYDGTSGSTNIEAKPSSGTTTVTSIGPLEMEVNDRSGLTSTSAGYRMPISQVTSTMLKGSSSKFAEAIETKLKEMLGENASNVIITDIRCTGGWDTGNVITLKPSGGNEYRSGTITFKVSFSATIKSGDNNEEPFNGVTTATLIFTSGS